MKKINKQTAFKEFNWKKKKVLITGGASFIGSTLTDALMDKGASIRVVDDLTSGKRENINSYIKNKEIEFIKADLREPGIARKAVSNVDVIFHLAGDHGGRGYVDLHQAGPASNLFLDGLIFWEAVRAGVEKITFASSGCVYPSYIQADVKKKLFLTEDLVKAPHDADNMYGWAKLMGELSLKAYHKEYGIKTASCRYFTVYGPRGVENHAVIAMIARAFIKQNPFEVWGNGEQIRNWTYVDDIVRGTILAAEKIDDGTAVNLGTMERIRVIDAVNEILNYTGQKAKIKLLPKMPVGPMNRVADNKLAKKLLGWEPEMKFMDGLHKTIDWYYATKKREDVKKILANMLTER
jgi:nucleoside-diphosphate-sugar epimerase